jgi:hypothetical protein
MLVAFVPSACSPATMSPANLPFASSCGVAALNSSLRPNGMSAALMAGIPLRSSVTQRP